MLVSLTIWYMINEEYESVNYSFLLLTDHCKSHNCVLGGVIFIPVF